MDRGQTAFLTALRRFASGGAQALVVIAYQSAAQIMVRDVIDSGVYDDLIFGDADKGPSLVRARASNQRRKAPRP